MTRLDRLDSIAPTVGKLIRLLASEHDGEAISAARALRRVLGNAGLDLNDLASMIDGGSDAPALSDWRDQLLFCSQRIKRLNVRDAQFIATLVTTTEWREPSAKQRKWLGDIVERLREAA
jgi:hypothetical protein